MVPAEIPLRSSEGAGPPRRIGFWQADDAESDRNQMGTGSQPVPATAGWAVTGAS
jgi:hypothetical protein